MILGFLGTGHITASVINGIIRSKLNVKKIYVSPRNKSLAKKLSKKLWATGRFSETFSLGISSESFSELQQHFGNR